MIWLLKNKDWIFSGIGVSIIGIFASWLFRRNKSSQTQKAGNNSANYQAGGDIKVGGKNDK